jgi:hypothetical protein
LPDVPKVEMDHEISSAQPLARQVEHALGEGP